MNFGHHISMEETRRHLNAPGSAAIRAALAAAFNGVMRAQREHYLSTKGYQHTVGRRRPAGARYRATTMATNPSGC